MEVFLIRHTAPGISKGLIYGRTNVVLADSFDAEKQLIIAKLPHHIDHVISSPLTRCTLLAREIANHFVQDDRLMEFNFGLWEGKTWDTIDRIESELWMEDYVNNCPPEGETLNIMNARVINFWDELIIKPYQRTAIVTHAGVIRLIIAKLNNLPLKSIFNINVDFGQIISLKVK